MAVPPAVQSAELEDPNDEKRRAENQVHGEHPADHLPIAPMPGAIEHDRRHRRDQSGFGEQVIWNLVSNAVKFSPVGGRVEVTVRRSDSEARIVVRDNGAGIDPQFLPFVFERFRQADVGTTRRHGGLGIGLAIAKHITEAHGGTIFVESAGSGQGAAFTVRLPAISDKPEKTEWPSLPSASAMLRGVRVLVVDDEADARDLMRAILEPHAAQVVVVGTAAEALHALQNSAFDVLIADIGMPEHDGYWLIRAIRQGFGEQRDVSAIAATAFAGARDREAAIEAGYNWYLAKPVDSDQLIALVAMAARGSARLA